MCTESCSAGAATWPLLVVSLDLLLYTHNWGIFLCFGLAAATAVFARERWRESLAAGAVTLLLYLPWVPTLLFQARHTGAPWAMRPGVHSLLLAPGAALGGDAGFGALARRRSGSGSPAGATGPCRLALILVAAVTIVAAWAESQISSAWTSRYFAVLLGPLLLVAAAGIVRRGSSGSSRSSSLSSSGSAFPSTTTSRMRGGSSARLAQYLEPG